MNSKKGKIFIKMTDEIKNKLSISALRHSEEIPKVRFPRISNNGTVSPIKGPATYQGQGCLIHSNIKDGLVDF